MSEPKKTIVINPDFLKLPMRGNRTKKNSSKSSATPKPIKIRSEFDKSYKHRALNYIRKYQEDKHKRMMKGESGDSPQPIINNKPYTDEFKSDFDNSLDFLQKLADQTSQKSQVNNATLKQYPTTQTNSLLFETPVLNNHSSDKHSPVIHRSPTLVPHYGLLPNQILSSATIPIPSQLPVIQLPKPIYGCLKNGTLPTYRTMKAYGGLGQTLPQVNNTFSDKTPDQDPPPYNSGINTNLSQDGGVPSRLTPEQQRAELKQFLEKRKEEKERVQRVKRQKQLVNPAKKQKRTTTRTFRVGKSKHYPKVGVLIPNRTIRTQVLVKKQKLRETPLQDVRKHLIKTGLIRVGSSCPNDVLRQMYESAMMMCGEIQNHNPDNLLYNYLHDGL